jgi:hypothetical protein
MNERNVTAPIRESHRPISGLCGHYFRMRPEQQRRRIAELERARVPRWLLEKLATPPRVIPWRGR